MVKGSKITVPRTKTHGLKLSLAMRRNKNQERQRSIETKEKISLAMCGNTNTLGKIYGEVTRLKDSFAKTGDKNPAWQGGISFEPYHYKFNKEVKLRILERNNFTCQLCSEYSKYVKRLHVHHIDYDKKNTNKDNLITLCHSCHSKTNHHRNEWRLFNGQFQRICCHVG